MNILKGLLVVLTLIGPSTLYAETMGTTKGSANYQTGIALSKTMASQGVRLIPIPHSGTAIYMTKVDIGKLDFGISGSYVLDWGYRGTTIFDKPHEYLRFVANLQHFKTAIVVRNNSDIKSIEDLRGKNVPSEFKGAPAFHLNMTSRLLNANPPLTWDDVRPVPVASLPSSYKAFDSNNVDVVIVALGGGSARKLNVSTSGGIRALCYNGGDAGERTLENWAGLEFMHLNPSEKTPSIREENCRIITFPYMLWANKDVPNHIVKEVVKTLYYNADKFRESSKFTRSFDESKMSNFDLVPMHDGAKEAYDELGLR